MSEKLKKAAQEVIDGNILGSEKFWFEQPMTEVGLFEDKKIVPIQPGITYGNMTTIIENVPEINRFMRFALYDHENFKKVYNFWKNKNPSMLLEQLRKRGWYKGLSSNLTPMDYFLISLELPSSKHADANLRANANLRAKFNKGEEEYSTEKKLDLGDLVKYTSLSDRAFFNQMKNEVQSLSVAPITDYVTENVYDILNQPRLFNENVIKQGANGVRGIFKEKSFAYDKINIKF